MKNKYKKYILMFGIILVVCCISVVIGILIHNNASETLKYYDYSDILDDELKVKSEYADYIEIDSFITRKNGIDKKMNYFSSKSAVYVTYKYKDDMYNNLDQYFEYELNADLNTASITNVKQLVINNNSLFKTVIIPDKVIIGNNYYPITTIKENSIPNNIHILDIPDSVTILEDYFIDDNDTKSSLLCYIHNGKNIVKLGAGYYTLDSGERFSVSSVNDKYNYSLRGYSFSSKIEEACYNNISHLENMQFGPKLKLTTNDYYTKLAMNLSFENKYKLDSKNTNLVVENDTLYNKDKTVLFYSDFNDITLDYHVVDSVKEIMSQALNITCKDLIFDGEVEVLHTGVIPNLNARRLMLNGVKVIESEAIYYTSLELIYIPQTIGKIGKYAINCNTKYGTSYLMDVMIVMPNTLEELPENYTLPIHKLMFMGTKEEYHYQIDTKFVYFLRSGNEDSEDTNYWSIEDILG